MKIFYLSIVCILLSGCKITSNTIVPIEKSKNSIEVTQDTAIYLEGNSFGFKFFDSYIDGDTTFMIIDRIDTKSFNIYNLSTSKVVRKIDYSQLFPDTNSPVYITGIEYHNHDSIFISSEYQLSLVQLNDNVIIYSINEEYWKKGYYIRTSPESAVEIDATKNEIMLHSTGKGLKNHILDIGLNLSNIDDINFYPFRYPMHMQKNNYGLLTGYSRAINGHQSVYSFDADPNIYIFNRKTGETVIKGGRSAFQNIEILPLTGKDRKDDIIRLRHFTITTAYPRIIYDAERKLYYRYFFQGVPEKNEEGLFNSLRERTDYLMVFDEKFELITELLIKDGFLRTCFVTSDGIGYFDYDDDVEHNIIRLLKIKKK